MPTIQLRADFDAAELRQTAKRCRNNRQIRRLLALAAVYDGMSRAECQCRPSFPQKFRSKIPHSGGLRSGRLRGPTAGVWAAGRGVAGAGRSAVR